MLISEAYAQAGTTGIGGMDNIMNLLPIILMFVLLYFLLLRPQMRRAKEQKQMIASLQKGDEVVTGGGTLGRVTKVSDSYVSLEIAPNVEITVQKSAIQTMLPKGTLKNVT
ncbi:MAG TPA: preprotein translocase subunit YajC [Burkholderiales bacterium]|nr:preprotein translocase subunit YajC [Burkholderiales bacterium]